MKESDKIITDDEKEKHDFVLTKDRKPWITPELRVLMVDKTRTGPNGTSAFGETYNYGPVS